MEDEQEIIYIALSNSIMHYTLLLEKEENLSQDDATMAKHLLSRTEQLLDKYAAIINNEEKPMSRPRWEQ